MCSTWLLALALAAPQEHAPGARVERRLSAMGTWLELEVEAADRAAALQASEAAVRAIEGVEARLSTWREDSELARLNRAPVGAVVALSPELADDLARARDCWRETDGAFDPGLGALVAAWGLRSGGRQPSAPELEAARAVHGFASFELDGRRAVRHHALAAIEEGGFGKGVGLDAALRALRAAGARSARLDFGGQLAVLGEEYRCALADPRERERPVLELAFASGSLATSGNSEHGIVVDGVPRGHLLDPRSGAPAPDFGSLSVWAADATAADCLSKLYVLGPDGALHFQAEHPQVELIALVRDGQRLCARASAGWRGRLRVLVPDLELAFVDAMATAPDSTPSSPVHR